MKIHVGSFWSTPPNNCKIISIARTKPANVDCLINTPLNPSYALLRGYKESSISWGDYFKLYLAEISVNLENIGCFSSSIQLQIVKHLRMLGEQLCIEELMLCCWERRKSTEERVTNPCHRDIIYSMLPDDVKGESID